MHRLGQGCTPEALLRGSGLGWLAARPDLPDAVGANKQEPPSRANARSSMAFLVFLVHAFVNTTQPTPEGARRAARYVGVALVVLLLVAIGAAFAIRSTLRP